MNIFIEWREQDILAQADASAERIAAGKPLSVLDGVPVAVKDEFHMAGYPTTGGTSFLKTVQEHDATIGKHNICSRLSLTRATSSPFETTRCADPRQDEHARDWHWYHG
jgi:hypothetical protein